MNTMRLNVSALALTCGILWGVALFGLTWWLIAWGEPADTLAIVGKCYRGYEVTPLGSVVGLAWGFADALIGGAIFAWLYNFIVGRLTKSAAAE